MKTAISNVTTRLMKSLRKSMCKKKSSEQETNRKREHYCLEKPTNSNKAIRMSRVEYLKSSIYRDPSVKP